MTITKKQIAAAARLSKHVCSANGYGHQVLVWPDGSCQEAVSENDVVCRLGSDDYRTYPALRISRPMTRAEVSEQLAEAQQYRYTCEARADG